MIKTSFKMAERHFFVPHFANTSLDRITEWSVYYCPWRLDKLQELFKEEIWYASIARKDFFYGFFVLHLLLVQRIIFQINLNWIFLDNFISKTNLFLT